jgi:hypothetical protein
VRICDFLKFICWKILAALRRKLSAAAGLAAADEKPNFSRRRRRPKSYRRKAAYDARRHGFGLWIGFVIKHWILFRKLYYSPKLIKTAKTQRALKKPSSIYRALVYYKLGLDKPRWVLSKKCMDSLNTHWAPEGCVQSYF